MNSSNSQKVPTSRKLALVFIVCLLVSLLVMVIGIHYLERDSPVYYHIDPDQHYQIENTGAFPSMTRIWNVGLWMVEDMIQPVVPNCSKLFAGDKEEELKVKRVMSGYTFDRNRSDQELLERIRNCSWLREYFSGVLYNSELERSFPLAYTFVVYDSPQQVLRLLRLLYRPQNSYCIHYDTKSKYKHIFQGIADCFDNMIVPSRLENVVWGHYSVLGAQMNCMADLLKFRTTQRNKWKYLLNVCGKELPLVTGREMVRRLKKLNGSSCLIPWQPDDPEIMSRIKYLVTVDKKTNHLHVNWRKSLGKPPFKISQYYKSQSYVALSYEFAHFLTTNSTAIKIHEFFKKCSNPEEHFYATMYMMPGVPGGYNHKLKGSYFWLESVFWNGRKRVCPGKIVHEICIVNYSALLEVLTQKTSHVFHNKYFLEYDFVVMRCLEERVVELNRLEYQQECAKSGNRSCTWIAADP